MVSTGLRIHANYNEHEVLIDIERRQIYSGYLPNRQLMQVFNWLAGNADWALEVFYELNPDLK